MKSVFIHNTDCLIIFDDLPKYLFVNDETKSSKKLPLLYSQKSSCSGCFGCYSICPMSGSDRPITAHRDKEGRIGSDGEYILKFRYKGRKYEGFHIVHTGAITMTPDYEGFYYPVIDSQLCIRCYKCTEICHDNGIGSV